MPPVTVVIVELSLLVGDRTVVGLAPAGVDRAIRPAGAAAYFSIDSSSTSKTSVAPGPMRGGAPRSP